MYPVAMPRPHRSTPAGYCYHVLNRGNARQQVFHKRLSQVAQPQTDIELAALRRCVERGSPYGSERWQSRATATLGLERTLRPRGRPRHTTK